MGQVNLTNITGFTVKISKFTINKETVDIATDTNIPSGTTCEGKYDGKLWSAYDGMIMDIILNGQSYSIDLNRDHYFGGENFRYPGDGSDINYVLMGLSHEGKEVCMMQVYRQEGADRFLFDNDYKTFDIQS